MKANQNKDLVMINSPRKKIIPKEKISFVNSVPGSVDEKDRKTEMNNIEASLRNYMINYSTGL